MMRNFFLLGLLLVLTSVSFGVAPKRAYTHDQDFILEHPYTISDKVLPLDLSQKLRDLLPLGAGQGGDFLNKVFGRKIRFHRVRTISGTSGSDALIIEITDKSVRVRFTSLAAAERAVDLLGRAVVKKRGVTVLQGTDVLDWIDGTGAVRLKAGDIDLSKMAIQTRPQLEALVARNSAGSELELTLLGIGDWSLESRTLDELNPTDKIISGNAFYTTATIRHVLDYAATRNVTIVPRFNLAAQRDAFRRVTGHAVSSVEGMRIVRAMISEWTQALGVTKINIPSFDDDDRFNDFLNKLQDVISVEIITR